MSRLLDDLHPGFLPKACRLLAEFTEAGIPIMIVDTLRTPEEQADYLRRGVSWTKNSKHLVGKAIDIAPYETYKLYGPDKLKWDANDPVWIVLGKIGESVGLRWGGRWKQKDMGHFEEA